MEYDIEQARRDRTRPSRPPDHHSEQAPSSAVSEILALQRLVGNQAVAATLRAHRRTSRPATSVIQRKVDGKIKEQSFGDWMFKAIKTLGKEEDWTCTIEETNAYVWPNNEITEAKDKDYFRHKEHLHLINLGTEVAVVFTYVISTVVDPVASKKKQTEQKDLSKIKQHSGGLTDEIRYNLSEKTVPESIENVPDWMCEAAKQIQQLPFSTGMIRDKSYEEWQKQYKPK